MQNLSCDYQLLKEVAYYIDKNAKGFRLEECIGLSKKEIAFEFKMTSPKPSPKERAFDSPNFDLVKDNTPLSFGEGQGVRLS